MSALRLFVAALALPLAGLVLALRRLIGCRHRREIAATVGGGAGLLCLDCRRVRAHPWRDPGAVGALDKARGNAAR